MKYQIILISLLVSTFAFTCSTFAQSSALKDVDLKNVVITMKQEAAGGWAGGIRFPYTVTFSGNGTVTFDGMDEGKAISRYEPPVKVLQKYRISNAQFKELVEEFYKIDFFSLDASYRVRDNGDGTSTIIHDGGLATVTTSLTINGKTKTVTNINFAPEKLIELQRKIFAAGNVSSFVKFPPYWLSVFPNEQFPTRSQREMEKNTESPAPKIAYRKIQRASPKAGKDGSIELGKKWGLIKPCVSTRADVEKLLGRPVNNDEDLLTYDLKNEKIRVFYSTEKTDSRICGNKTAVGTVILYSVIPIKDIKLSELNIDLTKFQKEERLRGREISYRNREEGIFIETEIVEFSDKKQIEMITSIQFDKYFKNK